MKNFIVLFCFVSIWTLGAQGANSHCNPPTAQQLQRSQNFLQNTPCGPVVTACNQGGYILNCHKFTGKGLIADCIGKLKHGTAVAGVSMQPNDPAVAACKSYCRQNKGACKEEKGVEDR